MNDSVRAETSQRGPGEPIGAPLPQHAQDLARSLSLIRSALDATADAILVTDLQGRITDFNRPYAELWGLDPQHLPTDPEHRRLMATVTSLISNPRPFLERIEEIYRKELPETHDLLELADGRAIERFSRIQSVDGHPVGRVWTFRDVTERRRADLVRGRLAAVVESSIDSIVTKTLQGIVTTWNKGAEAMFGYAADEIVGKSITMLIPPDRINEEAEILSRLARGQRIELYETVRRRKDGTLIDVALTISPVRDPDGNIVGASKIARDITQRKRAEAALREETRVLELLNQTGIAIGATLELQDLLQIVTDASTQLSGARFGAFFYNSTDESGDKFLLYTLSGAPREAFDQFGHPRATALFGPTFRGEGPIRSDDILKDPRYGKMAPHFGMPRGHLPVRSYLAVPVISRSGEVIGGLFFGHPEVGVFSPRHERLVTGVAAQAAVAIDNARLYEDTRRSAQERQRLLDAERAARAEAERVSVLKDEFLATLSHELRTPLNAILGWSQILQQRSDNTPEVREGLSVIQRNTRMQAQLIEDLLDMSRIISGKLRLDVQRLELTEIVRTAVASVRHSAEAREIQLHLSVDESIGLVRGDPNRLQQCVWNLLSNAIKFTPRGGRIDIRLQRVGSHIEIAVVDNGQGIRPDFLPHVFERFRQADASTTRIHGGLGLGLSIVKSLVEMHGGTIRADSEGEGRGATFTIHLPITAVQPEWDNRGLHRDTQPEQASPTPVDGPSLAGVSVLAVDDEPDARNLIRRVLEESGARVLSASSVQEAMELLSREHPDVIISDIGMPGHDGYELIRRVRKMAADAGGRTPAAALTAFARAEDRTRALRAGYQTHVAKPVEPMELLAVVASLAMKR